MVTSKKREVIDTFVCADPSTPLKDLKPPPQTRNLITHKTFWYCRVRFCWTTFLETAVDQLGAGMAQW